MSTRNRIVVLALATMIAAPAAAWAGGAGGPGCSNLPLYNRALGALQGMTSACDMSVEEARRIVSEHDGGAAPRPQSDERRRRPPQQ